METSTRRAVPGDARGIAEVHVASWRWAYAGQMPDDVLDALSVESRTSGWRAVLALPEGDTTLVAERDGSIVGFASVGAPQHPDDAVDGWAELLSIYVDEPGTGAGTELLAAAEREMLARSATTGILWVLDSNDLAATFYERRGWHRDGANRPHPIGDAELTVVRFVKELIRPA